MARIPAPAHAQHATPIVQGCGWLHATPLTASSLPPFRLRLYALSLPARGTWRAVGGGRVHSGGGVGPRRAWRGGGGQQPPRPATARQPRCPTGPCLPKCGLAWWRSVAGQASRFIEGEGTAHSPCRGQIDPPEDTRNANASANEMLGAQPAAGRNVASTYYLIGEWCFHSTRWHRLKHSGAAVSQPSGVPGVVDSPTLPPPLPALSLRRDRGRVMAARHSLATRGVWEVVFARCRMSAMLAWHGAAECGSPFR